MHKKALECAKKTLEEFCALGEPTCEQAELFKMVMCGLSEFTNTEYKAKIIDGMNEAEEEEKLIEKLGVDNGRMGYNRRRYQDGRFAPKMNRMGFNPDHEAMDVEPEDWYMGKYIDNPMVFKRNMRMGYNGDGNTTNGNMMGYRNENVSRHGENYNLYREARKHFTETDNPADKEKMDKRAKETYHDALDVFRELWREGDPTLKNAMKTEIQTFVANEMR